MTDATLRKNAGWPTRLLDLTGRKVRAKRELANGWMRIPAGYVLTVEPYSIGWEKLELEGAACACCGVKPRIGKVSWRDLRLLPTDEAPELPAIIDGPNGPELGELVERNRVAQPDYARLGIDDPEGRN